MTHEHTLNDLIKAVLKDCNFDSTIIQGEVEKAYRDTVGEFIVKLTRSVRYNTERHTLYIVLSSPALKNELSFKTHDLISSINKRLQREEVSRIIWG